MSLISTATKRNWSRLHTDESLRLTQRANKKKSVKKILPTEYLCNNNNREFVQDVIGDIEFHHITCWQAIYSLAVNLIKKKNLFHCDHVQNVLNEYSVRCIPSLVERTIPDNEWDILGLIYQCLLFEGKKNETGAYYTPKSIVEKMTNDFKLSDGQTFLDPCCGSGSFLLSVTCDAPMNLFGIDNDPIAVLIAKTNLLLKYHQKRFTPQIFCGDGLALDDLLVQNRVAVNPSFDFIATNPPWGAVSDAQKIPKEISSKESFSSFFVKSYQQLKSGGLIRFLVPESILNVRNHRDIRDFILDQCRLEQITLCDGSFSGVTTKYLDILCSKNSPQQTLRFIDKSVTRKISIRGFRMTSHHVFSFMKETDLSIVDMVKAKGRYTLSQSVWALGIVTGDNKNRLKTSPAEGLEPIYTGKEIQRYTLKPAKKYLNYDRGRLQQVAKDDYYRAPEKLVYKFISNKLVFSYDNTKSLFLNSANIVIPSIPGMSLKTVMAFLNSELFQFYYCKMFGEMKVLKGNLMEIPFPAVSSEQNDNIEGIVNDILAGNVEMDTALQDVIYAVYGFSEKQISCVRNGLNEK